MAYRYLFGPVPSRRLGRSLGVDLIPYKTCSFDCVFCQLGRTTKKTLDRAEYVKVSEVCEELKSWFKEKNKADCVTLAGSGEPTLNSRFEDVIEFIKTHSELKCVVLTNGSTLCFPEVRKALCLADIVKVSLSCWDDGSFFKINRPHRCISFDALVEGEIKFREEYKGILLLEVFLIKGVNDRREDVKKIADLVERIKPDKVHLNTAVRPTAEPIKRVSDEELKELSKLFNSNTEPIGNFSCKDRLCSKATKEEVLNILKRRPCTVDEVSRSIGINRSEVVKYINILLQDGLITSVLKEDSVYYVSI